MSTSQNKGREKAASKKADAPGGDQEKTGKAEPRQGGESVFISTIANHRVGGCQFVRGSYATSDPLEIERIRQSAQFGQTVSEVGTDELADAKA